MSVPDDNPNQTADFGVIVIDDNAAVVRALADAVHELLAKRGIADTVPVQSFTRVWEAQELLEDWSRSGKQAIGIVDLVPSDFLESLPADAPPINWPPVPPEEPIEVPTTAKYIVEKYLVPFAEQYAFRPLIYTFVQPFLRAELPRYDQPFARILRDSGLADRVVEKSRRESAQGAWRSDLPKLMRRLEADIDSLGG